MGKDKVHNKNKRSQRPSKAPGKRSDDSLKARSHRFPGWCQNILEEVRQEDPLHQRWSVFLISQLQRLLNEKLPNDQQWDLTPEVWEQEQLDYPPWSEACWRQTREKTDPCRIDWTIRALDDLRHKILDIIPTVKETTPSPVRRVVLPESR